MQHQRHRLARTESGARHDHRRERRIVVGVRRDRPRRPCSRPSASRARSARRRPFPSSRPRPATGPTRRSASGSPSTPCSSTRASSRSLERIAFPAAVSDAHRAVRRELRIGDELEAEDRLHPVVALRDHRRSCPAARRGPGAFTVAEVGARPRREILDQRVLLRTRRRDDALIGRAGPERAPAEQRRLELRRDGRVAQQGVRRRGVVGERRDRRTTLYWNRSTVLRSTVPCVPS